MKASNPGYCLGLHFQAQSKMDEAPTSASQAVPVHIVLPAAALAASPSSQDGVATETEQQHRFFGCQLIQEAGILLRLPQVVMATAQTLLQRFYYRASLRDFDAFRAAIGCIFLAAKVEERPRRVKDVLSVFYAIFQRRKWGKTRVAAQLLDVEGAAYCQWREWLVLVERQLLLDLGFSIYNVTEHPHKYVLYYIKMLDGSQALAQKAWGYINDSLCVDLCVRYRAEAIACAAIFLASRVLAVALPDSPPWYTLFEIDKKELVAVSVAMMKPYKFVRIEWLDPLTEVNPFAVDDHPEVVEEQEESPTSAASGGDADVTGKEKAEPTTTSPQKSSSFVTEPPVVPVEISVPQDERAPTERARTPERPSQPESRRRRSPDRFDDRRTARRSRSQSPRSPRLRRSRSAGRREARRERESRRGDRRRSRSRSRSRSHGRSGARERRRHTRSRSRSPSRRYRR